MLSLLLSPEPNRQLVSLGPASLGSAWHHVMDQRFSPESRLRKRWEYLQVQSSGQKLHSNYFLLLHVPGAGSPRLGVTVSKKVSKKAVVRNYLRRCIRETFRRHREAFAPGDWVVIARQGADQLSSSEIEAKLCNAVRRHFLRGQRRSSPRARGPRSERKQGQ